MSESKDKRKEKVKIKAKDKSEKIKVKDQSERTKTKDKRAKFLVSFDESVNSLNVLIHIFQHKKLFATVSQAVV